MVDENRPISNKRVFTVNVNGQTKVLLAKPNKEEYSVWGYRGFEYYAEFQTLDKVGTDENVDIVIINLIKEYDKIGELRKIASSSYYSDEERETARKKLDEKLNYLNSKLGEYGLTFAEGCRYVKYDSKDKETDVFYFLESGERVMPTTTEHDDYDAIEGTGGVGFTNLKELREWEASLQKETDSENE